MTEVATEYLGWMTPHLVPVEEAAVEAGISKATLFRWMKAGLLTRYHTPKGIRRRTLVNIVEVRRLQHRPPGHLAD